MSSWNATAASTCTGTEEGGTVGGAGWVVLGATEVETGREGDTGLVSPLATLAAIGAATAADTTMATATAPTARRNRC